MRADEPRAGSIARRGGAVARPQERIEDVRARLPAGKRDTCAVVDGENVVVGLLEEGALDGDGTVASAMNPSPSTVRASASLDDLRGKLDSAPLLVTTPEGRLLGTIRAADLLRRSPGR